MAYVWLIYMAGIQEPHENFTRFTNNLLVLLIERHCGPAAGTPEPSPKFTDSTSNLLVLLIEVLRTG